MSGPGTGDAAGAEGRSGAAAPPVTDAVVPVDEPRHGGARSFALVVLGAVLWGTGGLAGAALGDAGLTPAAVAALRLGGGGAVLVVVLAAARALPGTGVLRARGVVVRLAVVAALLAGYQACYFSAIARSSVSVATLVALGAAPVLVAVATSVASRRAPSPRVLAATGLALAGLVLLVAPDLAREGEGAAGPAGPVLALLAAVTFAAVTLVNRRPVTGLEPVAMTGLSFVLGGLLLAPWALTTALTTAPAAGAGPGGDLPRVVGLVAFLAVVPTAAAWAAYFTGLRGVAATTASLVALLEPLTAAVGAAVLRGERVGVLGVLGGVALAAATLAVAPRHRRAP